MSGIKFGILVALLLFPMVSHGESDREEVFGVIQAFYLWVIEHGKEVQGLEPKVVDVPGSHAIRLDTATLPEMTSRFMQSGLFSGSFPDALSRYYHHYQTEFKNLPQSELDEMAADGRGPMHPTEDMNLFFCAQEYDWNKEFVRGITLKTFSRQGDKAEAVVRSPYEWETTFHLVKGGDGWRIAGYCVFE